MAPNSKRRKTSVARASAPIVSSHATSNERGAKGDAAAAAATVRDWRRKARCELLRSAVAATGSLGWSQTLLNLLCDELYVADALEGLIGCRLTLVPLGAVVIDAT